MNGVIPHTYNIRRTPSRWVPQDLFWSRNIKKGRERGVGAILSAQRLSKDLRLFNGPLVHSNSASQESRLLESSLGMV